MDPKLAGIKFCMAPSLDSSDHQDYYMFRRIGDSELNLHFPLLQGGGRIQVSIET